MDNLPSTFRQRLRTHALLVALLGATLVGAGCSDDKAPLPVEGLFTKVPDLTYARYGDVKLELDLYLPDNPVNNPVPVVIAVRGGGFRRGDKEAFGPIAGGLADRGLAAASIEYRTSNQALFPGATEDTKAAIRWLRANATTYGLDPEAIGTLGGSAGGYLSAILGTSEGVAAFEGQGGNGGVSSDVQAVVAMAPEAGPTAQPWWNEYFSDTAENPDEEARRLASSLTHIDDGREPPLLLIHSSTDDVVPLEESRKLVNAYEASGNSVELVIYTGAPHAFWYQAAWFTPAMDAAADFLTETLVGSR